MHLETKTRRLQVKTVCPLAQGIMDGFITYFTIFYNQSFIYLWTHMYTQMDTTINKSLLKSEEYSKFQNILPHSS